MAATFDNFVNGATVFGGTSITSSVFTVAAGATDVVAFVIGSASASSSDVVTACRQTAAPVSGATGVIGTQTIRAWTARTPSASSSQTVTWTWTTAQNANLGALTFLGSAGVNNGNAVANAFSTQRNLTITSTAGDLTVTALNTDGDTTTEFTNFTKRVDITNFGHADTGPGTGTSTHSWQNNAAEDLQVVGLNVIQFVAPLVSTPWEMPQTQAAGSSIVNMVPSGFNPGSI